MNSSLTLDAGLAEWGMALAALAGLLALAPYLRALPQPLKGLRVLAAVMLIFLLIKPVFNRFAIRGAQPRLSIFIDTGPSMHALDDWKKSRLARAMDWLKRHRSQIEAHAQVSLFAASGQARRILWEDLDALSVSQASLQPASLFSDMGEARLPASRLWLISDGAFEGSDLETALGRVPAPIDTLGVGPRQEQVQVSITEIDTPDFVFQHSRFEVSAVFQASQLAGGTLKARLYHEESQLTLWQSPVLKAFEIFRATFTAEAKFLGAQAYRLELVGQPSSGAQVHRQSREFRVETIRQKYRIMYLAGRPSFEYSHLRAQLKGDPNHELVSFVILRNPDNVSPVPDHELSLIPFPAREIFVQSLFQFDLFILENFAYWRFNLPVAYLEHLKRFVAQGGALLVIGGSNAFTKGGYQGTPLEEALPVTLWPQADDFQPGLFQPEVLALNHPLVNFGEPPDSAALLWQELPALDGFSRFASVRPGASVLLRHPTEKTGSGQGLPVIAVREFGRGKVMLIGTDSTWRWKLGGGRRWKAASFYGRFWSRAVQYLTGSLELKKVKFSPLPDRLPAREPAVLSLRVFNEHFRPLPGSELDLKLAWVGPGGKEQSVPFFEREPGVFQIELTNLSEGRHLVRAWVRYKGQLWGTDEAAFFWQMAKGDAPLDRKQLKHVAELTGGRYSDLHRVELEQWLKALPPSQAQKSVSRRMHVWASAAWLWILGSLLTLEWFLRRRRGYI